MESITESVGFTDFLKGILDYGEIYVVSQKKKKFVESINLKVTHTLLCFNLNNFHVKIFAPFKI